MFVTTIKDSEILLPNAEHKSFAGSNKFFKKGVVLNGDATIVDGMKRGKPFSYRLFKTNNNNYTYLNNIKPNETMANTEITLGADGQPSTVINEATGKTFENAHIIGAVAGAILGYWYCKHKAHDSKKMMMYVGGVALLGFGAGKFIQHRKGIKITKSK